jgi:hypothetical protein
MGIRRTCSHQEHRHVQVRARGTAAIAAREPVSWRMRVSHVAVSASPSTPGFFALTNGRRRSTSFSVSVCTRLRSRLYALSLAHCSGESLERFFDAAEEDDWAWKVLLMLLLLLLRHWRGVLGAQERLSGDPVSLRQMWTWLWMVPHGLCESAIRMWGFGGGCGRGRGCGEGVRADGLEVCLFLIGQQMYLRHWSCLS